MAQRKPTTTTRAQASSPSTEVVDNGPNLYPDILSVDAEAIQKRLAARMDAAQGLDDLFDAATGNLSKNLIGKVVLIRSVAWQPYESSDGTIPCAVVDSVDTATGEEMEWATTAKLLTKFLHRAQLLDLYPFTVRIVEKGTKSGNKALNFERP